MVKEMTQQFENMKPNDHRWRLFMQNSSQLSILAPDQSLRKETQARPMAILLCIPSLNITRPHSTSSCCPVYQWTLPTFKFHYKKNQSCKVHKSKKTTKLKHDNLEEFHCNRIFDVTLYIQSSRRPDHGSPSSFNGWGAISCLTSSLFSLGFFVLKGLPALLRTSELLQELQVGQQDIVLDCNYHFDSHEAEQLEVKWYFNKVWTIFAFYAPWWARAIKIKKSSLGSSALLSMDRRHPWEQASGILKTLFFSPSRNQSNT